MYWITTGVNITVERHDKSILRSIRYCRTSKHPTLRARIVYFFYYEHNRKQQSVEWRPNGYRLQEHTIFFFFFSNPMEAMEAMKTVTNNPFITLLPPPPRHKTTQAIMNLGNTAKKKLTNSEGPQKPITVACFLWGPISEPNRGSRSHRGKGVNVRYTTSIRDCQVNVYDPPFLSP